MNRIHTLRHALVIGALAAGLARAQSPLPAPAPPPQIPVPAESLDLTPPTPTATPAETVLAPPSPPPTPVASPAIRSRARPREITEEVEIVDGLPDIARLKKAARAMAGRVERLWVEEPQRMRRTFVLPSEMLRGQVADDMHEDLAVMARIFGKAASKSGKNQREFAFRFAEERDLEAMYLGGAGALFFVSVDWPVAGPVKAASKPDSPKKDADSLWEQEKRRLQGDAEEDGEEDHDAPGREPDTRTYDPVRVGLLKDRLSAAYRHAANIRGVQPQEDIVVVVLGRRDAYSERGRKGRAGGMGIMSGDGAYGSFGGELPVFLANERAGGSTLVLRAKKSDVDRLASGKAGDAEFTKIVKVDSDYPVLQDSGKPPTGRHP